MGVLRLISKITITQVPNKEYPSRDAVFILPFCNEVEINSTWENLTDICKITLPNKIYFTNDKGVKVSWFGSNIYGGKTSPIVLRGDKIKVELGYIYPDYKDPQSDVTETYTEFVGYITRVSNSVPIVLECEDEMYRLKQIQCPTKVWDGKTYDVGKILTEILKGSGVSVNNAGATLNVGNLRTGSETVAQLLDSLQRDYRLESYFRINSSGVPELRCSGLVYYPFDRKEHVFHFQKNIVSDDLQYFRLDDQNLGIKAYSTFEVEQDTGTRLDGSPIKRKRRLSVTVPDGFTEGELRTVYFWDVRDEKTLKKLATERLNRFYYEGFQGSFVAFGLPSVKHGDAAVIVDATKPERNGTYLIKKVVKTFGMNGYRQDIELDLRIDGLSNEILSNPL